VFPSSSTSGRLSRRVGAYAGAAVAAVSAVAAVAFVLASSAGLAPPASAQSERAASTPGRWTAALPAELVLTTGTQAGPAVLDCGLGQSQVRPRSLVLTCADGNDVGKDLVWSKWSQTAADATGVDTWNECVPNCAASKTWYSTAATFTLSKPVRTTKGWLFERLTVHITGHAPPKVEKVITFSEAPVSSN
jgi:hypothetical protein